MLIGLDAHGCATRAMKAVKRIVEYIWQLNLFLVSPAFLAGRYWPFRHEMTDRISPQGGADNRALSLTSRKREQGPVRPWRAMLYVASNIHLARLFQLRAGGAAAGAGMVCNRNCSNQGNCSTSCKNPYAALGFGAAMRVLQKL